MGTASGSPGGGGLGATFTKVGREGTLATKSGLEGALVSANAPVSRQTGSSGGGASYPIVPVQVSMLPPISSIPQNVVVNPASATVVAPSLGTGFRGPMTTWGTQPSIVQNSLLAKAIEPSIVEQNLRDVIDRYNTGNGSYGIGNALKDLAPYQGQYGMAREPLALEKINILNPPKSAAETYALENPQFPSASMLGRVEVTLGDLRKAIADGLLTDPKLVSDVRGTTMDDSTKLTIAGFQNQPALQSPAGILGDAISRAGVSTSAPQGRISYGTTDGSVYVRSDASPASNIAPEAQAYAEGVTNQQATDNLNRAIDSAISNIRSDTGLVGDGTIGGGYLDLYSGMQPFNQDAATWEGLNPDWRRDVFTPQSPVESGQVRNLPYADRSGGTRWHAGIDFAAPTGTAVTPSMPGTVVQISSASGYGPLIDVQDIYGNIQRYAVHNTGTVNAKVGQQVFPGDLIGTVGAQGTGLQASGKPYFEHLHFENISPADAAYSQIMDKYNAGGGSGFTGVTKSMKSGGILNSSSPDIVNAMGLKSGMDVNTYVGLPSQAPSVSAQMPSGVLGGVLGQTDQRMIDEFNSLTRAGVSPEVATQIVNDLQQQKAPVPAPSPAPAQVRTGPTSIIPPGYYIDYPSPIDVSPSMPPIQQGLTPDVGYTGPLPQEKPAVPSSFITDMDRAAMGYTGPIPREKPAVPSSFLTDMDKKALGLLEAAAPQVRGAPDIPPPKYITNFSAKNAGKTVDKLRAKSKSKKSKKTKSQAPTTYRTNFRAGLLG